MSNVNKVILVGHLGQTPVLNHTAKGTPVLNLSVATNREFKDAQGIEQKEVTWHRATVWGKQAESCAKYLTCGSRVFLEGELRVKTWTDKDGQERKTTEVNVNEVKFLGGARPSDMRGGAEEPTLEVAMAH
jgi:single-strand DNA-binding protein